jgi:hypothetical protein
MSRGFLEDDAPRKSDLVDLDVTVLVDRPHLKAWLVKTTVGEGWVPKSVGELDGKVLTLPRAFAEMKGLV